MVNNHLVGGDWNHGILNDFPFSWEWKIIPTDELHDFWEGLVETTNQTSLHRVGPSRSEHKIRWFWCVVRFPCHGWTISVTHFWGWLVAHQHRGFATKKPCVTFARLLEPKSAIPWLGYKTQTWGWMCIIFSSSWLTGFRRIPTLSGKKLAP